MNQRTQRRRRIARAHRPLSHEQRPRRRAAPRVVPLTGDASDRRYFRVILADGESIVLALHAGPIDFATLPFANVAALLDQMPLPVPAILGHADADGIVALAGPRRRDAAGAPRRRVAGRARGAVPGGRRADRAAPAPRRASWRRERYLPYGSPSTSRS